MRDPDAPSSDPLMREAATWFARMRGPDATAAAPEFEAWLRRGALHRAAYNRAAEIFAMGKMLSEDEPSAPARPTGKAHALWSVVAALVLAIALAGIWFSLQATTSPDAERSDRQLFATARETRAIMLADGSRVILGEATSLEVETGPRERRLRLLRGHARFDVFHETRPFIVEAGGGRVTARGTIFDVAYRPGSRIRVRLIEGAVDVSLPQGRETPRTHGGSLRRLQPGDTIHFEVADGSVISRAPVLRSAHAPASDDAPADFASVTIGELIERSNRQNERAIRIVPSQLGERRVSGRLRLDDPARLAGQIAALLDLAVENEETGIVLRHPRPAGAPGPARPGPR